MPDESIVYGISPRPNFGRTLLTIALLNVVASCALAQGRGGRGMPGATPEQNAAVAQMNADLAPQTQGLAAARTELIAAALAQPRNDAAIKRTWRPSALPSWSWRMPARMPLQNYRLLPTGWLPARLRRWPERGHREAAAVEVVASAQQACRMSPQSRQADLRR